MADYFYINNVPSTNFNCYIANSNVFDSASEDVQEVIVPGRNGSLHIKNNRFNSFTGKIECYIPDNMETNLDALRNYLLSLRGTFNYAETRRPNEYRIARFTGKFEVSNYDKVGATLTLSIVCRPERFLTSGQTTVTMEEGSTITNPTLFASKPLLRAYGTGTITVNNTEIIINTADVYTDIDCESMQCYKDDTNCNSNVEVDEFPELIAGVNDINLGTITKLEITPRWWTI